MPHLSRIQRIIDLRPPVWDGLFLTPCGSFDLDQQSGFRGAERGCDARYEASFNDTSFRPPTDAAKVADLRSPRPCPVLPAVSIFVGRYGTGTSVANPHHCKRTGCGVAVVPRKTAISASLAVWMASSMPLHADNSFAFDTGKSLLGSCDGADLTKQALCLGTISGYADMLQALKMICLDNNVNRRQTVMVVLKFLSDHPEDIDKTAPSLALAALTKAFPCSADASKK